MSTQSDPETRRELEAALEARRELGDELELEVLDSFLAKIEGRIDARVDERVAQAKKRGSADKQTAFVLALVSLGCGIPITAIALEIGGLAALAIVWAGIVLVNLVYNRD